MADLLSAISVLLVFLTFLLQVVDKEISSILKERNPFPDRQNDVSIFKNRLYKLLFLKAIPISFIYLITAYSLVPITFSLMKKGRIDFVTFDPLNTIFIFIHMGIVGLFIYSTYQTIRVIKKMISVK